MLQEGLAYPIPEALVMKDPPSLAIMNLKWFVALISLIIIQDIPVVIYDISSVKTCILSLYFFLALLFVKFIRI